MICPRCGGRLLPTSNPYKLQCQDCGRVFKNYVMRYYKCERCAQPCFIATVYEVPESCPYGFSQCQFKEITPHNFIWGVRRKIEVG
jgi:hypothetical protein